MNFALDIIAQLRLIITIIYLFKWILLEKFSTLLRASDKKVEANANRASVSVETEGNNSVSGSWETNA